MSPQCVIEREKMQPEKFSNTILCKLCLTSINHTDSQVMEEVTMQVLEIVLPNINLEKRNKHLMCKVCCSKLFAAYNFKAICIDTEDIISPRVSTDKGSVIELKELYLKTNGNIQLTDMWEKQRICRLCLQQVTYGFVSLNEVDNEIIDTYIPEVNINATRNPVICTPCFDSLCIHGSFLRNCITAQENYENDHKQPYNIKFGDIEMKMEDCHDTQEKYKTIEKQFCIKSEEIEIKTEKRDLDNDTFAHNLNEETVENEKKDISEERQHEHAVKCKIEDKINEGETPLEVSLYKNRYKRKFNACDYKTKPKDKLKRQLLACKIRSEIRMYRCDTCDYESKRKGDLKYHQLTHKDPSDIQMYRCDACNYETKRKDVLKSHQLTHKAPSEIQMYRCEACDYETKRKGNLKGHQVTHKQASEIQMYKCDFCTYETKHKNCLKAHQLLHKDPSEIQMYRCDACDYETKRKSDLNSHQLTHKDVSDNQMYKCHICAFETKYKSNLKYHKVIHKNPSEIQMYRCDACNYETKRKDMLKSHQLTHKNPSEIQMYRCEVCEYKTKRKGNLNIHQLIHKDASEIQMYKCDCCIYQTKYKNSLKTHQLVHKNPSEIQMYKCDACDYKTKVKCVLKRHQLTHKDLL